MIFIENDKGLPDEKLKEIAMTASDKIYEQDDLGPVQSIKNSLAFLLTQITNISKVLQENELQFISNKEEKVCSKQIQWFYYLNGCIFLEHSANSSKGQYREKRNGAN